MQGLLCTKSWRVECLVDHVFVCSHYSVRQSTTIYSKNDSMTVRGLSLENMQFCLTTFSAIGEYAFGCAVTAYHRETIEFKMTFY